MWEAHDEACDCKSSPASPHANVLRSCSKPSLGALSVLDLTLRIWLHQFGTRLLTCKYFDRLYLLELRSRSECDHCSLYVIMNMQLLDLLILILAITWYLTHMLFTFGLQDQSSRNAVAVLHIVDSLSGYARDCLRNLEIVHASAMEL